LLPAKAKKSNNSPNKKIGNDRQSKYSEEELKFLEACLLEQTRASGNKQNVDSFNPDALIEIYRKKGALDPPKSRKSESIPNK